MRNPRKSSFKRLAEYLTDSNGNPLRVQNVRFTNCVTSDDLNVAIADVLFIQNQNQHTKNDKTMHLMLSFRENLSPELIHKIEDEVCEGLGYKEHQRMSVVHGDTDNQHLHIAINKINPRTLTVHDPLQSKMKLQRIAVKLEQKYGLIFDNHTPKTTAKETAAKNMELAGNLQSFIGYIQRTHRDNIKNAGSWQEIHEMLVKDGIELKKRGNGLVFVSGKFAAKASSVDREFSKGKLEKRLGAFEENKNVVSDKSGYKKEPLNPEKCASLWTDYLKWKKEERERRKEKLRRARLEREEAFDKLHGQATDDFESALIKYTVSDKWARDILYAVKTQEMINDMRAAQKQYADKREEINKSRLSWRTWLQNEAKNGNEDALKRIRERGKPAMQNGVCISGKQDIPNTEKPIKVTWKGALLFETGIRDTGTHIFVPRNANKEQMKKALEMAEKRFGQELKIEGNSMLARELERMATENQKTEEKKNDSIIETLNRRNQIGSLFEQEKKKILTATPEKKKHKFHR